MRYHQRVDADLPGVAIERGLQMKRFCSSAGILFVALLMITPVPDLQADTHIRIIDPHAKPENCLSCHSSEPTEGDVENHEYKLLGDSIDNTATYVTLTTAAGSIPSKGTTTRAVSTNGTGKNSGSRKRCRFLMEKQPASHAIFIKSPKAPNTRWSGWSVSS